MPLVSVLLAVHNGSRYLSAAVDSMLGQTVADLELVAIDDGSTDETPDLLAGVGDQRLVMLRNEEQAGLAASLNRALEAAGGRYVDVAVMAPVDKGLAVPLLVSGPHAIAAQPLLASLGFSNIRVVGEQVGRASAIKMIRSVMVKGIEALSWECAAAAEAAGVFDEVMASLDASEKPMGWARKVAYNRERMETHGLRRAAEMEESAKTLQGLGIEPVMTRGTVVRQRQAAKSRKDQAA